MVCVALLWSVVVVVWVWRCFCDGIPTPKHVIIHNHQNHRHFQPLKAHEFPMNNSRHVDGKRKLVCYLSLPGSGSTETHLTVKKIDPTLCTHIIISKARIENDTIVPLDEGDFKVYADVVAMKKQNPSLQVLLSITSGFSSLVEDPRGVAIFAYNAHKFLITHGFNGLDLDWEFPAWPPWKKNPKEKERFNYLVLQLNNALKLASHPPLMLTVAVGGSQDIIDSSYEIDQLAKYVDFVSVMGYNYHKFEPYMPFTGHNAPLTKSRYEDGYFSTLNIHWVTQYWMKRGMPKDKLIIGIPTFGRSWKLLTSEWHNVGAPAVDEGMFSGKLTYTEACIFVKEGATYYFDDESKVPYAVRERDWISYENAVSIKDKAQWILDAGVAGVMIWNLNSDDWAGLCAGKAFELHNIIKDIIH